MKSEADKIIMFDNLPYGENTVAKLEEVFNITLAAKKSSLVDIGEPEIGSMRSIFIDDKKILTSLVHIPEVRLEPYKVKKNKYRRL